MGFLSFRFGINAAILQIELEFDARFVNLEQEILGGHVWEQVHSVNFDLI